MKYLIALGTNATSDQADLISITKAALEAMRDELDSNLVASSLYQTPAFPRGAGPDFINAACRIACDHSPEDVLDALHRIEGAFGRTRQKRWGQRSLDLDLIAASDLIVPDEDTFAVWQKMPIDQQMNATPTELIVPHPRLQDRAFVLVPLSEIAPGWRHPVLGLTVAEMLARRPAAEIAEVILLDSPQGA